ncbi:hypothetical protein PCL_00860 [Purpureocillium lilacinum]|uniref:Uncharacterized protein n=1 Tax=Purpureocillium lilacinum TaxID=33203 RepID=A0A2U3E3X6_PURLI|nr:hypothetical protein PCL_00860 [Purpureocillium lilacinum]
MRAVPGKHCNCGGQDAPATGARQPALPALGLAPDLLRRQPLAHCPSASTTHCLRPPCIASHPSHRLPPVPTSHFDSVRRRSSTSRPHGHTRSWIKPDPDPDPGLHDSSSGAARMLAMPPSPLPLLAGFLQPRCSPRTAPAASWLRDDGPRRTAGLLGPAPGPCQRRFHTDHLLPGSITIRSVTLLFQVGRPQPPRRMAGAAPNHGRSARRFALLLPTFDIACGWLLEESNTRGTRDSRGRWPNSNLALAGTAPLACPADSPLAGALMSVSLGELTTWKLPASLKANGGAAMFVPLRPWPTARHTSPACRVPPPWSPEWLLTSPQLNDAFKPARQPPRGPVLAAPWGGDNDSPSPPSHSRQASECGGWTPKPLGATLLLLPPAPRRLGCLVPDASTASSGPWEPPRTVLQPPFAARATDNQRHAPTAVVPAHAHPDEVITGRAIPRSLGHFFFQAWHPNCRHPGTKASFSIVTQQADRNLTLSASGSSTPT